MKNTNVSRRLAALVAAAGLVAACGGNSPEQRLERAANQVEAGDYRVASVELRNVLRDEPENARARLLLGRTNLALGDLRGAQEQLERARALGADVADYGLPLAQSLAAQRRGADALALLDELEDRDARWHVIRGDAYAAEQRAGSARAAYDQALEREPENVAALLGKARLAAQDEDFAAALTLAERAIDLDDTRVDAHALAGTLRLRIGDANAAAEALTRAVEVAAAGPVTSDELGALATLAQVQLALNDRDGLRQTRDRLQSRAADAPITHYVAGAVHHLEGNYRDAATRLREALSASPDNVQVLTLSGANHLALDNLGQAEQNLQRALSLQAGHAPAARLLAEVRRRQGSPGEAIRVLQRLPDHDENPQLLALMGALTLEDGRPDAGVDLLERAQNAAPGVQAIQLQLARAYIAAGREDDAVAMFEGPFGTGARDAVSTAVSLLTDLSADGDVEAARERAATRADAAAAEGDAQALMGVALFHQATGDGDTARALLERSLDTDSDFNPARVTLASLRLNDGEIEPARALYRDAVEREPGNVQALMGLAQVATQEGADDEAAALLRRAADADAEALAPRLAIARLELGRQDAAAAREAIEQAARSHPDDPEVATYQGILAFQAGDNDAAIGHFRRAADADPPRGDRWFNLARAQASAEDNEGARTSLRRARELSPQSPVVLGTLAQVELVLGDPDAAADAARALQRVASDAPDGYLAEGNARAAQRDWSRAERMFAEAYTRQPSFDAAYRQFQARRARGHDDALAPIRTWLDASPDDARARLIIAQDLQESDRREGAVHEYERIIERDPENVVALNNLAWLLGELGEPGRGVEYARRAFERAPEAAPVLDTYGWLLVQAGEVEAGIGYLEQAVQRAPQAADLRFHLGSAQATAGRTEAARGTLNTLLEEHPEFERRDEVERILASL